MFLFFSVARSAHTSQAERANEASSTIAVSTETELLTEDGEKLLKQLKRRIKQHEARIATAMTPAETATLVDLLTRIRTKLQTGLSIST